MSETTTAEETETVTTEPVASATETDWKAEVEKWKAMSRKNEAEAKSLRPAAQKLAELEEAQKSELDKATARAEAAEKKALETELAALRASVALEKGLTPSQAKRLVGASREDLEADADELLVDLKNTKPNAAASSEGQGKQGDPVGQTQQITSRDQLKSMSREEKLAAYKDGRLKSLMG
jgi:hypothetical protein